MVSPDGKWLLYIQDEPPPSKSAQLMRIPVIGGASDAVLHLRDSGVVPRCARFPSTMCALFEPTQDNKSMVVTSFDPVKGVGAVLTTLATDPNRDNLSPYLSPDGTRIALVFGAAGSTIRIFTVRRRDD